jgi:hypothetical protein
LVGLPFSLFAKYANGFCAVMNDLSRLCFHQP